MLVGSDSYHAAHLPAILPEIRERPVMTTTTTTTNVIIIIIAGRDPLTHTQLACQKRHLKFIGQKLYSLAL